MPVGSKKGRIFLFDVEAEKKRELERRRKIRIQQVRQQSKDLANVIRKKVQSEKENEETRCKKAERITLQQYHESKLKRLEELYKRCLEDIGDSHVQAAREPNAELLLKARQAQNAAEALVRGEEAKRRQEEILLEQKIQKEAPIKQKKIARAKEDLRSALVVRLPQPRDRVKNETDSMRSGVHKSDSPATTKSLLDVKSNQQKTEILQEIPSNIRLQIEGSSIQNKTTQNCDTSKSAEKPVKKDVSASIHTAPTNQHSSGDCENINKRSFTCNHHIDDDHHHSKRNSENKLSSDRGYHSDGDYESAVRGPHQHCINKHYPCYCRIKYYDHCNHFQSQYKRRNPVTPHHDTDPVSPVQNVLDEKAVREKNKKLDENMQKSQARGREAIRRELAKQKFQKLLKEISTLDREERLARCKSLISNVNMGESMRRAALATKQQRMNVAFEKLYTATQSRSVTHDDKIMDSERSNRPVGERFVNDSPPATLNVADWKTFAASHSGSQSFHPFHEHSKYSQNDYNSSPPAPQYSSLPSHHTVVPPVVGHLTSPEPPSPPSSHPPNSLKLPASSSLKLQNNNDDDEEESLNTIFQRIDHHRKVLLGELEGVGDSKNQKENLNKRVTLAFSKQFVYSVSPEESKNKVIDDYETVSEVSDSHHVDSYNRRKKLSKVRSRSETRKKKLATRDHSEQQCTVSNRPSSPSKCDIQIQTPSKEHYKIDADVQPIPKSDENLQIGKKTNIKSVDIEASQGDNKLPLFNSVEVTIRVSEKDKKKSPKKIKERNLLEHENLRPKKPVKYSKITDSSTSYYSPPDRITPSQKNLIDAIMSHIHKRGLSSHLKQHIQNLLSMNRENINDLGISSSDVSIDSVYIEPVSTKQSVTKDNSVLLKNEVQSTNKNAGKNTVLNPEKKELQTEAAEKTADIMSQYSQLSEMLVKNIEKLAKVGSCFNESFKPTNNERSAIDLDTDTSKYPVSTADSSYLHLPQEIDPNLPVGRDIIEAFSSGNNRYSQLTSTFNELSEPQYFGHHFFLPFQTETISKEISGEKEPSISYSPNNSTHNVKAAYVPMNSNSCIQQPEVQPQHKENYRRFMPPPTLSNGRFRFGMESSPPHELTTIPEVDTPGTHCNSNDNFFSEQEEAMHINVFEGLDVSQDETNTSSISIKSFDSVSSVPDVDSVLMKRNVITSPFENRRKRKVMQVQNKESQQNFCTGSSNVTSSNREYLQINASENNSDVSSMTRNVSPVQYINHKLGIDNEVINLENGSGFKPNVKSVSVDNITCEEIVEVDNTKHGVSYANEQVDNVSKTTFQNNVSPFPKIDKCVETQISEVPFESYGQFSDFADERLAKFNEILKDLDEAKEIMSDSTPEDLQLAFHRLGVGWAGTTLRKTQEAQELNSGSTSATSESVSRSDVKENMFSNWKRVEEDLTPPSIYLRAPVLLSASTTNLKKYKTRKYIY